MPTKDNIVYYALASMYFHHDKWLGFKHTDSAIVNKKAKISIFLAAGEKQ
ncbi:MAG: hypothetical protein KAR19_14515 [Bacteroidales bacterium]|nr:hypothetical protein [Bacteroidales bacterium]